MNFELALVELNDIAFRNGASAMKIAIAKALELSGLMPSAARVAARVALSVPLPEPTPRPPITPQVLSS